jgi:carbon storage regulator
MLVLSRKKDEKIILKIGDKDIEITVVRIESNKVRIGIQADPDVIILRSELTQQLTN